ncbi:hypothetical protein CIG11343_1621 [Campylobacter iguaniorum]|uniref:hypothetical protein n=1 Tax=Campylobacter iguaniorum TaxID=1244531 RepID=UPI0007C91B46|nr:hypothetical protein [Campylobacter iguaniorum]ANE36582.1 hypothetical protein CIG11343_1621 [Campylobacter iguaniorum]
MKKLAVLFTGLFLAFGLTTNLSAAENVALANAAIQKSRKLQNVATQKKMTQKKMRNVVLANAEQLSKFS